MILEVRTRLEDKLKAFSSKTSSLKSNQKELLELQQLGQMYKRLVESKDFDLRELDQLKGAERELKQASLDN